MAEQTRRGRGQRTTTNAQPVNDYGRIPPQATDLEEAVLGALMIEKDAYSLVSELLRPQSFYEHRHQLLYQAITNLAISQQPIDLLTVKNELEKEGTLDEVGGPFYITQLTSKVASAAHVEFHARIIAQKALARELISYSNAIQSKAFDETQDVEDLMQEAEGKLFEISQQNLKKDYTQINPIVEEAYKQIQSAASRTTGLSGLESGFHDLDKITSGWQNSDLVIIAARPAMGKTAFVLSMAKNMAVNYQCPVAFFSLEMSNLQLVNRLIANTCEIESDKIRSGRLQPHEWERLDRKLNDLLGAPLYIDDTPSLSVFELRTKARRLVREHQVKIIFIDYLQLMNASGMSYGNRQEEVSTISRSLKGLAKELNIPIIALSQLNRSVESRGNADTKGDANSRRPQLSAKTLHGRKTMKKRIISIIIALVMVMSMMSFTVIAEERDGEQPETIILFTNDVHCGIEDNWGYAGLAKLKKDFEAEGINTLLVDAGDHVQGGPIGTLSTGGYIIDIMNFVGYDLAIPGNHEFDYTMERFFELVDSANYPYISANFMNYENGQPTTHVLDAYKLFEVGGKTIAFVGVCTPETITKSTPIYFQNDQGEYIYGFCQDNSGDGLVNATQTAIDAAKAEGADYVVVVGHLGVDEQSSPWMSTEVISRITGADAFIDGHSHSVICEELPDAEGHTVLHGQTGTKLANIGALKIYADGHMEMELLAAPEEVEVDPDTQAFIDDINGQFEELLHTVVAYTPHILTVNDPETGERAVRKQETNLGDLCADAYRELLGADIAFVNGGGVRANINPGEITFENILNVHPFGNAACLVEVTGQQILDALEMGSRNCPDENGGFLQVAGITYEIHTDMEPNVIVGDDKMWQGPAGIPYRVQNVMVMNRETRGYEPLDLNKIYTLASHNYMLKNQGDGFAMFGTANVTILQDEVMLDNAVLINYIQSMPGGEVTLEDGTVATYDHIVQGYEDPRGEGRIIIVNETEPGEPDPTEEPTEEPVPTDNPNPPATGAITLIGFGVVAAAAGAGAFIFRKKED